MLFAEIFFINNDITSDFHLGNIFSQNTLHLGDITLTADILPDWLGSVDSQYCLGQLGIQLYSRAFGTYGKCTLMSDSITNYLMGINGNTHSWYPKNITWNYIKQK